MSVKTRKEEEWIPGEDWYNPGFLKIVDDISDVTTREIYDCLGAHDFSTLKSNLKTKTIYDEKIQDYYDEIDNDCP